MPKNLSETEFSNKILRGFVCIFSMFSILVFLSLGLKIEHFYWKLTEFCITLEPTMSKMLGKINFFWFILSFKNFRVSTGIKDKKQV